ncbi:transcriptional regulator [Serinibacter arcticus]|uniref:Transcriptional regulator n=1 Tax=Serinibacter arcticus TaxID=1655435 RepID=A0A2U1ZZC7_9MICO|nr:transcriptional regulator [Serinibacter arcticus]
MRETTSTLDVDGDTGTRDRVRALVVQRGPVGASTLAEILDLTPAAVRRHLAALVQAGEIAERAVISAGPRGRGRPAREYVATPAAQHHLPNTSAALAADALRHLADVLGPEAVAEFAQARVATLEATYRPVVEAAGDDLHDRARALAQLFSESGYAASTRELGTALQLCQGHCPVQQVAEQFPQLCEAETGLISRLLGVHVQRLATIASGGHACTTHIPTISVRPPSVRATQQPQPSQKEAAE